MERGKADEGTENPVLFLCDKSLFFLQNSVKSDIILLDYANNLTRGNLERRLYEGDGY